MKNGREEHTDEVNKDNVTPKAKAAPKTKGNACKGKAKCKASPKGKPKAQAKAKVAKTTKGSKACIDKIAFWSSFKFYISLGKPWVWDFTPKIKHQKIVYKELLFFGQPCAGQTAERNRIYSRVYRQAMAKGNSAEVAQFEASAELVRQGFTVRPKCQNGNAA